MQCSNDHQKPANLFRGSYLSSLGTVKIIANGHTAVGKCTASAILTQHHKVTFASRSHKIYNP